MRKKSQKKEEFVDTRTREDIIESENALKFLYMLTVILFMVYAEVISFFKVDIMEPDIAAFVIIFISLTAFMIRSSKNLSANPNDKATIKSLKDFRIIVIVLAIYDIVMLLIGRNNIIRDGRLTIDSILFFILPFMMVFYILLSASIRRGKKEDLDEAEYDETVVKEEIRRRDAAEES